MKSLSKILVLVDCSKENCELPGCAVELAAHNNASLTIVDVIRDFSWPMRLTHPNHERLRASLTKEKGELLSGLAQSVRQRGVATTTKVLHGRASVEVMHEVAAGGHELVILTAKGRRSRRAGFFGSTATRLLRKCPSSVLALQPSQTGPFERVLAAVDGTPGDDAHAALNARILEEARAFAGSFHARLDVVHAWSIYGEHLLRDHMSPEEYSAMVDHTRADQENGFAELLRRFDMSVESETAHLIKGEPADVIPILSQELAADLLVIGTVARTGIAGLITGNTCETLLERVNSSVLALKPENFVSPVMDPARVEPAACPSSG